MKNWFAAANLMYRQTLVKSFASSASIGGRTMISFVSRLNNVRARDTPSSVKLETICGRLCSSVIANPSAMRSGQNASSTCLPSLRSQVRSFSVIPG